MAHKFVDIWSPALISSIVIALIIVMLMSLSAFVEIQNEKQDFRASVNNSGHLLHLLVYQSMRDDTGVSEGYSLDDDLSILDDRNDLAYFQILLPDLDVLKESSDIPELSQLPDKAELTEAFQNGESLQRFAEGDNEEFKAVVVNGELVGFTRFGFSVNRLNNEIRQIIIQAIALTAIITALGGSIPYLVAKRRSLPAESHVSLGEEGMAPTQERQMQAAKMDAVGQLAYGMAHEINNPLASILGFAQLGKIKAIALRQDNEDSKEASTLERYLEYIEKEAKRSADLIRRLLSFSLSPDLKMAPVDINELLEQSIKMNVNQLAMAGITPELHLANGVPQIEGHTASLIQAFDYIIANAVTAMPEGGVLNVSSRLTEADAGIVELSFQDTGIGIPEENISKVFEPFFTTSGSGRSRTGLGMYACYQIVRQHNGETKIASREGEGTTVSIMLPVPSNDSGEFAFVETVEQSTRTLNE